MNTSENQVNAGDFQLIAGKYKNLPARYRVNNIFTT